jgi:glycosyltransferase involved in cell wall biosynthesis
VSRFSQGELAEVLGLRAAEIAVIPNGGDHVTRLAPQDEILAKLQLTAAEYFLVVGSPSAHKNLAAPISAFALLADKAKKLVLVGASAESVFQCEGTSLPPRVITAGRVNDEELASLYGNACALIFPSLYEGFGIPPLEAMYFNCPVVAADIPPVREVCGDAAVYFDPNDFPSLSVAMAKVTHTPIGASLRRAGETRRKHFSWNASASLLHELVYGKLL